MKKSSGFVDFLLAYLVIMGYLIYLLVEPLIFATVGLIYQVPWQYYLVSIGGYAALTVIWELVVHFFFRNEKKKYHSPFIRRFKKLLAHLTEEENASNLPDGDN